jgi:hypothetical protein
MVHGPFSHCQLCDKTIVNGPRDLIPLGHFWFLDGKRPDSTGLGTQLFAFSKDCIPIVDFDAI